METYECSRCKTIGLASDFKKCSIANQNRSPVCKKCESEYQKRYSRSKNGFLIKSYDAQVTRSKRRGHNPPSYSQQEFVDMFIDDVDFCRLHKEWEDSGYSKMLAPSFDRADNFKGYSMDNFNGWMTWEENNNLAIIAKKNGLADGGAKRKPVALIDNKGNVVDTFISASEAGREYGIQSQNILKCANGLRQRAGGLRWALI